MFLLDLRNQLSLDKYNWEDVHYYGTILDTNHKYWTEIGTSDATHGGEAAQLGRAERFGGVGRGGGGLRCGNVPVQNNVNRFLFKKAKYI